MDKAQREQECDDGKHHPGRQSARQIHPDQLTVSSCTGKWKSKTISERIVGAGAISGGLRLLA
ncbi:hypothetical protein [Bradyrhizobium sp. JR3.5]